MTDATLALLGGAPLASSVLPEADRSDPVRLAKLVADHIQERGGEISALTGCGPIEELEALVADRIGVRHGLGVCSGTAALHVALLSLGVGPGDEVVVCAYDWGAATAATMQTGATVVFADIDPCTYTIDPDSVAACLTSRTAAIIATHLFGQPADMRALRVIADRHGLALLEDAAHALGTAAHGVPAGTLGDIACFSLGAGKDLDAGEGGLLVTDDAVIHSRAVRVSQHPLRHHRFGLAENHLALSLRLHPLAALVALHRLDGLDERLARRRSAALDLGAVLADVPGIRAPYVPPGVTHAFYRYSPGYVKDLWDGVPRELVVAALAAEGVAVSAGPIGTPLDRRLSGSRCSPGGCPEAHERCDHTELTIGLHDRCSPREKETSLEMVGEAINKVHRARGLLRSFARDSVAKSGT